MIVSVIIVLESRWLRPVHGNCHECQGLWKMYCNLVSERNESDLFFNYSSGVYFNL